MKAYLMPVPPGGQHEAFVALVVEAAEWRLDLTDWHPDATRDDGAKLVRVVGTWNHTTTILYWNPQTGGRIQIQSGALVSYLPRAEGKALADILTGALVIAPGETLDLAALAAVVPVHA